MSNDNPHDARIERVDGTYPPLVKIEGDTLPMDLFRMPTLRAVVPVTWALPPHAYADEVVNRADRLLNAYYAADPDEYWTGGSSEAYVFCRWNRAWLLVMPESNSDSMALDTGIAAPVLHLAHLGGWEDRCAQAETLARGLLALGIAPAVYSIDDACPWRNSHAEPGKLKVDTSVWSVGLTPQRDEPRWCITLRTDCYRLMRGDPMAAGSDVTDATLAELKRAVYAVSTLSGGGPAGIRVEVADVPKPMLVLRVLPSGVSVDPASLLTPEEALCRVANGFPGSALAHWASVRSPSLVEHAVETSGVSLSLRRLLFLNGGPRSPREVVEDLARAARTTELDAYSAEVVASDCGDKVLRLERAENKAGSASLAEALLEIASDDCSECVAWCEAFELVPLSRGCWRGKLCPEDGRWCLRLRTSRHAMLETGLPPDNIARELRSVGKLVEELYGGASMLLGDVMANVEIRPADRNAHEDIRTAAAWTVTAWLTYSFPDGDGELPRYLDRLRQSIIDDTEDNDDKEEE